MSKSPRSIVLDGYYGMRNAGDDAFCVVGCDFASSRWGATDIAVNAEELPVLPIAARPLLPLRPRFRGHRRFAAVPRMVKSHNVVHVGGSTFRKMNKHRRDQKALARLGLIKLRAVGVSIGPFRNLEDFQEIRAFLRHFQSISVRDKASMTRLRELEFNGNFRQGFDVAVLLPSLPFAQLGNPAPPETGVGQSRSRRVLGVSVCGFERFGEGEPANEIIRRDRIIRTLRRFIKEEQVEIRFIALNGNKSRGDMDVCREYADRLGDKTVVRLIPYSPDVREVLANIADCDALLGMRLHSCVFAYSVGIPFAAISYHAKCREFAEDVGVDASLIFPSIGPDEDAVPALAHLLEGQSKLLPVREAQAKAQAAFEVDWR